MADFEDTVTLQCVSNKVGGNLVGNATWQGVQARRRCSTGPACSRKARRSSATRSTTSRPASRPQVGLDGRTAMVAVAMNGEPLPAEPRLPGPPRRRRAVRLRVGDEVAGLDRPRAVGGLRRLLGARGLVEGGPDQDRLPHRRAAQRGHGRRRAAGRSPAWRGSRRSASPRSRCRSTTGRGCRRQLGDATSGNTWVQWYLPWDATSGRAQDPGAGDEHRRRDADRPAGRPGARRCDRLAHPHGQGPLSALAPGARRSRRRAGVGCAAAARPAVAGDPRPVARSSSPRSMLQQTQVPRVIPKWLAFCAAYPTPAACAAAPLGDVLRHWQGLGYPRRARNLCEAAGLMVERHGGCAARRPRRAAGAAGHRSVHGARRAGVRLRARRRGRRHEHRPRPGARRRRAADAAARSRRWPTRSCRRAPGGRGTRC